MPELKNNHAFVAGQRFYILLNKKLHAAEVPYDESRGLLACGKCGHQGLRDIQATPLPSFYKYLKIEHFYDTKLRVPTKNINEFNLFCCPACGTWYQGADAIGIIGEETKVSYKYRLCGKNNELIDVLLNANEDSSLRYLFWFVQKDLSVVLATILVDEEGRLSKLLEGCAEFDKHLKSAYDLLLQKRLELITKRAM